MLKRKIKAVKAVKAAKVTAAVDDTANDMHKASELEERLEELSRDYVILRDGIAELQRKRDLIDKSITEKAEIVSSLLEKRSTEIYERAIAETLSRVFKYLVAKPVFETQRFYCLAGDEEFARILSEGWVLIGSSYDHNKNKLCQIAQRVVLPETEEEFLRGYGEFYRKVKLADVQTDGKVNNTKNPKRKKAK